MSFLKLDEYTVPGFGLNVGLSASLKDEDASGESSGTARAKKGNKGKKLEVRLSIRFTQADDLRELMRVAEATTGGDGKVYTVTNDTANAAGMRQACFTGTIRADEVENLRKWEVSFTLVEHISVPEMAESREAKKSTATQTNGGSEVGTAGQGGQQAESEESMGTIEKLLKILNDKIGPESDG